MMTGDYRILDDHPKSDRFVMLYIAMIKGVKYEVYDSINHAALQLEHGQYCDYGDKHYSVRNENYKDFETLLSLEKTMYRMSGIPIAAMWMTRCTYGHFEKGCHVFCWSCLDQGRVVRRIQGCKEDGCLANNSFFNDQKDSVSCDLFSVVCNHSRVSSSDYFYSMTPVEHIVMMTNAGLDDLFIHSTPSELLSLTDKCSSNHAISPSCSFNSAYGFSVLGETEVTEAVCYLYRDLGNPQCCRDSLHEVVDKLNDSASVEQRFFKIRGNQEQSSEMLLKPRYTNSHKTDCNESSPVLLSKEDLNAYKDNGNALSALQWHKSNHTIY